jgi:hypothetical protein
MVQVFHEQGIGGIIISQLIYIPADPQTLSELCMKSNVKLKLHRNR